ncbi:CMRF35-like molecule 9 [Megalops cyprinoides]|uniref:CMRF35-like molecule 9 n=1 Tax=Megalops cyprinoides TaxID=118141 RepID=UPI001864F2A0|nr:CMRF35-like molecule 9 [Megalops cyprinoides]
MAPLLFLLLFFSGLPGFHSVKTVSKVTVQRGGSVTIPCHYDQKYKDYVKYWCRGYSWPTCTVIARTDSTRRREDVSITDDPAQQVFTVTMRNLQERDSNKYWCAVKIKGFGTPDDKAPLFLTVSTGSPGLSVLNNTVVGEEGGSVSIQCLYSDSLKERGKKWCRSGDWSSCMTAGGTGISQHASVQISDDRRGEFNVTVRRLERKDTGWYWCTAGDTQVPVHISVVQPTGTQRAINSTSPPTTPQTTFMTTSLSTGASTDSIASQTTTESVRPATSSTLPPTAPFTTPSATLTTAPTASSVVTKSPLTTAPSTLTETPPKTSFSVLTTRTSPSTLATTATSTPAPDVPTTSSTSPASTRVNSAVKVDTQSQTSHSLHLWQVFSIACGVLLLSVTVAMASWKTCRKRRKAYRRWETDEMETHLALQADGDADLTGPADTVLSSTPQGEHLC